MSLAPPARAPLLVLSPHLDDAALSCAWLLDAHPGSVVATVFAALPDDPRLLTAWDRECGFRCSLEAMRARRQEDSSFAAAVHARTIWLPVPDGQYRDDEPFSAAESAIFHLLARYPGHGLVMPLGITHPDHRLCHEAALAAWRSLPEARPLWLYEDSPYRACKAARDAQLAALRTQGLELQPCPEYSGMRERKAELVAHYASQWARLATHELGRDDCFAPERLWCVRAP